MPGQLPVAAVGRGRLRPLQRNTGIFIQRSTSNARLHAPQHGAVPGRLPAGLQLGGVPRRLAPDHERGVAGLLPLQQRDLVCRRLSGVPVTPAAVGALVFLGDGCNATVCEDVTQSLTREMEPMRGEENRDLKRVIAFAPRGRQRSGTIYSEPITLQLVGPAAWGAAELLTLKCWGDVLVHLECEDGGNAFEDDQLTDSVCPLLRSIADKDRVVIPAILEQRDPNLICRGQHPAFWFPLQT